MRLRQRLITLPPGVDIVMHDGVIPKVDAASATKGEAKLASLRDKYLETHSNGTLEAHTLRGMRVRGYPETFSVIPCI